MIIIGIDPGLKATGYGVLRYEGNKIVLLETGTVIPKQKAPIEQRINKVYANLDDIILQYKPDCMVLEKLYAHSNHPLTASILGHVRGVICLLCAQHKVSLIEHSVKRIRQSLTGNGNASKQQTQRVVAHVLKIKPDQLTLDASDALALALGYINLLKFKL